MLFFPSCDIDFVWKEKEGTNVRTYKNYPTAEYINK